MKRFHVAGSLVFLIILATLVHPVHSSSRDDHALSVTEICPEPIDAQVKAALPDRMNPEKLRRILVRIGEMAKAYCPWKEGKNPYDKITDPLVSLEEFFDGNNDKGSIGPNLDSQPTPAEFYSFLREIRSRSNVYDVRILVTQYDGPGNWPFSDTVFVITSESPQTVEGWIPAKFKPDEVGIDAHVNGREAVAIPAGMQPVTLWYD
ncbi:hypothetical protein ACETRX_30150 [Labrys portucalensis]|uniref:Uncharacterized protein n=1 Tax=Labrys neptuniae TaxID=376174 RepID=A0ABV6ZP07_9HYPH